MLSTNNRVPGTELKDRIRRLQKAMTERKIDAALILQKADLYYFAGTIQQAHLYVPADGLPLLMVRKDFERARGESALDRIVALERPEQIPRLLRENELPPPAVLGLENDVLPVNLFFTYRKIFEGTKMADVSLDIRQIRAVKSPYEIAMIRQATRQAEQVLAAVPELLCEGMTEIELAGQIEARARALGHPGIVRMRLWGGELFYGHIMAGPAAAEPSYLASPTGGAAIHASVAQGASGRPIGRGEPVLVDYVFVYAGYIADQTRIFSIGALPADLAAAHDAMVMLHAEIARTAGPGTPSGALYDAALAIARDQGYADHFMGVGSRRVRFVGHGVGLELDEFPFLAHGQTMPLTAGMTLALEPKLVFPGKGVVGIENTLLITETGAEVLTRYPEGVIAV